MFAGICSALRSSWHGRELEPSIGGGQLSAETLMEKVAGLDHDQAANAAGRIADNAAVRIAVGQPGEGTGSVQPYLRPTQRYDRDVAPIDITGLAQRSSVLICTKVDILLVPLSPCMFDREKPRHSSVLPDSGRVHQVGSYQGTPVVVPTYSRPT
jgi:hypothetical protein